MSIISGLVVMSIDDYLVEIGERGWTLRYLRQNRLLWEAMLAKPVEIRTGIDCTGVDSSLSFLVGFGSGRSPTTALLDALETAETSASLETCALQPAVQEPASKLTLASLMKALGPMTNQFKFTRRLT